MLGGGVWGGGEGETKDDCHWVGSLDFMVEIKLGFPLNPQAVIRFLQRARYSSQLGCGSKIGTQMEPW